MAGRAKKRKMKELKRASRARDTDADGRPASKKRRTRDEAAEETEDEDLEGLVAADGTTLYLGSAATGRLFDASRHRVGTWDAGRRRATLADGSTLALLESSSNKTPRTTTTSGSTTTEQKIVQAQPLAPPEEYPFKTEPDDHCETPLEAYCDVAPALEWVARHVVGKDRATVRVYDPYYCAGGTTKRLGELGFRTVRNRCEDCYSTWDSVDCDVLVTNPPYSGDHLDRLAARCLSNEGKKPFFWLVPEWAHKRRSIVEAFGPSRRPLYLSPSKRYVYAPPPGARAKTASDTHKKTAPFHSIWIVWAGPQTDALARFCSSPAILAKTGLRVARSRSQLRDLRRRAANSATAKRAAAVSEDHPKTKKKGGKKHHAASKKNVAVLSE